MSDPQLGMVDGEDVLIALRRDASRWTAGGPMHRQTTAAADEIERLRAQVAERDEIIARLAPVLDLDEALQGADSQAGDGPVTDGAES